MIFGRFELLEQLLAMEDLEDAEFRFLPQRQNFFCCRTPGIGQQYPGLMRRYCAFGRNDMRRGAAVYRMHLTLPHYDKPRFSWMLVFP